MSNQKSASSRKSLTIGMPGSSELIGRWKRQVVWKVVDDPDKKKKKRLVWRVEGGDAERAEENEEVQKKKIKKIALDRHNYGMSESEWTDNWKWKWNYGDKLSSEKEDRGHKSA